MKKILVVDDSALMRKIICDIILSKDGFTVEEAPDGEVAFQKITSNEYDAVLLDMVLPKISGLNLLGRLQKVGDETPIVAMSSTVKEDAETALMAAERGAVDFLVKPFKVTSDCKDSFERRLFEVLNIAISAKGRIRRTAPSPAPAPVSRESAPTTGAHPGTVAPLKGNGKRLIALACSTGGPQALHEVIPMLPANLGVPMVLVQHMPAGFTESLATRLNQKSKVYVKEAAEGDLLEPNTVYIAAGGKQMEIKEDASGRAYTHVFDAPPVNNLRPCADVMYESLKNTHYDQIICPVLTGMGQDGTNGIASLKQVKEVYVISQSEGTCVVYGMPKSVDSRGLTDVSVDLGMVAATIVKKLGV